MTGLYDTSSITSYILWRHYNDIGLYDTSSITSDILRYQSILTVHHNITLLDYNDTEHSVPFMAL